ncbi:CapA family protein [Bacillus alkalicellulosilyticus]|uniref:CapA family protein n=1 Tax=Alkalihalobacterium alkalicellulosilyticum TaxID=1912214 RepID=UPI001FE45C8D|nr:CapA family protein [Bacillus alkalicellulosilyticus]
MKTTRFIQLIGICIVFGAIAALFFVKMEDTAEVVIEQEQTKVLHETVVEGTETEPVPEPIVEPVTTTATLAAVGDVLIHSSVYTDAFDGEAYDFKPMLAPVKALLEEADITFANQETVIGGVELGLSGYPNFNSPYEVGDALKDAGVDIVSTANNHTLDRGEQAIINAITHWNKIGMLYTGSYESFEDQQVIRTIERNDITFAFLAFTYGTNGIPIPTGKEYLVNLLDVEYMTDEIKRARQEADVVVVSLHFGNEYEPLPNEEQKRIAHEVANAGANIILGHHPHVLQPVDWIETDSGESTFVIYSLGNFLAAQEGIEREVGGIVRLEVEKTTFKDETTITIRDPRFIPTYASKQNWRNYRVYPLEEVDNSILANANDWYDKTIQHMNQWVPELLFSFE